MISFIARIILASLCAITLLSPFATARAATPTLEITELFPDPAAPLTDADDEFIEFHNLTDTPIDLAGYTIKTGTSLSTSHTLTSAIVPAGGYLALKSAITKIALANAGSSVAMFDPAKIQIDQTITYGLAPTGSTWSKSSAGIWSWSTSPTPGEVNQFATPGQGGASPGVSNPAPSPTNSPDLLITELFPDPAAPLTDAADEFIEIYNPNPFAIDLNSYSIKTGSTLSTKHLLASTVIQPNSYVALKSASTKIALANAGSSVALFDPSGGQIGATITYPKAETGASWARNDDVWSWSATPTPAAANIITAITAPSAASSAAKTGTTTTKKSTTSKTTTTKPKASTAPKATKATATKTTSSPLVASATTTGGHWLLFILAALTIAYIIYEFRYDLQNYYFKLRSYPARRPAIVEIPVRRGGDRTHE